MHHSIFARLNTQVNQMQAPYWKKNGQRKKIKFGIYVFNGIYQIKVFFSIIIHLHLT